MLERVLVSAQTYDPNADDVNQVLIQTSTLTDVPDGEYSIFIQPGAYNIVAYKNGYAPLCSKRNIGSNQERPLDFTLHAAETGTVSGKVEIGDPGPDQHVTLSFRQSAQCDPSTSEDQQIEVKSVNVANSGSYSVILPVGTYQVVASTYGKATQVLAAEVESGEDTEQNIFF